MIEVKKLVKTFDGFTALDSATLTVPKGAVYGLVGPNGAGKSTLLRHITGVYKQDSGQVLVNGVPVFENRHVKERIVSIPDDWFYYNQSTIREMAKLYAGMYPQFDGGRFEKLRELFHLPEKKPIRRMSKGMQRQAAFWITMSRWTAWTPSCAGRCGRCCWTMCPPGAPRCSSPATTSGSWRMCATMWALWIRERCF